MPADAPADQLPAFLGIGALKAGTTYLDVMLRSHPNLSLPRYVKEVEYFNRHFDRGADWYAKQFDPADGRLRGEVSPQYLGNAECAARIGEMNPSAKLIVSVRDPIGRLYSQYRHWRQVTGYAGHFEAFLSDHPRAITTSKYALLLEPYREVFPVEQVHVVVFEDMVAEPLPVIRALYEFLGVDEDHVPPTIDQAEYTSREPRYPRLYVRGKKLSRWLYEHGAGRSVARLKASAPAAFLTRSGHAPEQAPDDPGPSSDVIRRLQHEFHDDVAQLSSLLGRDMLALWRLNEC